MSAPYGNANALKWTLEKANQLVDEIDELSYDTSILYLGQALSIRRTSTKQWNRIKSYYSDNEELMERMEAIEQVFEARLTHGALTGRLKSNMVQFILRQTQAETEKAEQEKDPEEMLDAFAISKCKSPEEYKVRVKYLMNHAHGMANAMRWNEQNPHEVPLRLDELYVAEPANSSCIKFAEGVYVQL